MRLPTKSSRFNSLPQQGKGDREAVDEVFLRGNIFNVESRLPLEVSSPKASPIGGGGGEADGEGERRETSEGFPETSLRVLGVPSKPPPYGHNPNLRPFSLTPP